MGARQLDELFHHRVQVWQNQIVKLRLAQTDSAGFSFHTARLPGSTFTFTIQADSHLDSGTSAEVYLQSFTNARSAKPDFHMDLGDTFMTEKFADFREAAAQ